VVTCRFHVFAHPGSRTARSSSRPTTARGFSRNYSLCRRVQWCEAPVLHRQRCLLLCYVFRSHLVCPWGSLFAHPGGASFRSQSGGRGPTLEVRIMERVCTWRRIEQWNGAPNTMCEVV